MLLRVACAILATTLASAPVFAASVRQTSVGEMLDACELIFEGEAIATGVEESEDGRHLFTWVDFAVLDVVKGPTRSTLGPRLRLHFLGGALEDRVLQVGGMVVPEVGERGLYFVESLARRQVHPLYGWDQGRLRLLRDAGGVPRVVSADGRPVVGVQPGGAGGSAIQRRSTELSEGVAHELQLAVGAGLEGALSAGDLKARLRSRLGGGP
jgi:hypothetical protein